MGKKNKIKKLFPKRFMSATLSNSMNSSDIHRKPTVSLRELHQQRHCQLGLKDTDSKNAKRQFDPPKFNW